MKTLLALVLALGLASGAVAQDACLEAVGGLSAGHTYTSYLLIGTTADGFAKKAFDAEHVSEVATEIGTLCGNVTGLLAKLRGGKLSESDAKYLGEIEAIYALLKEQSAALAAYAKSNKNEDMEKYEKARTTVYPKIQTLLGIGGDKDASPAPAK